MSRQSTGVIVAAIAAALLLWSRKLNPGGDVTGAYDWWPAPDESDGGHVFTPEQNLGAFLYMLQAAETGKARADSAQSYQTFYGGSTFSNLSDHPVVTGEKSGIKLPDDTCRAAGFGPGCVSTAAGAYQFIVPTWWRLRRSGSWGPYLADFSPEAQDEAARRQLLELGALDAVQRGDFGPALAMASRVWASLPGSTAQQNPKRYDEVYAYFQDALSTVG